MYHALVESRVPFELVHEAYLTDESLDRFKLLILADAAALSNAQCDAIRRYVARGGSLLATFASSLYDEFGEQRADFGLADVFGVSFGGRIDGPMQNAYLSLDADAGQAGGTRFSTASATRRASSTACSGSTCSRARTGRRP